MFAAGDKLVVRDRSENRSVPQWRDRIGTTVTVKRVAIDGFLHFDGVDGGWNPSRFEKTDPLAAPVSRRRCGKCGEVGHNARTCGRKSTAGPVVEPVVETEPIGLAEGDSVIVTEEASPHVGKCGKVNSVTPAAHDEEPTVSLSFGDGSIGYVTPSQVRKFTPVKLAAMDVWELAEKVLGCNRLTLLYGPPGTGKTTIGNRAGSPEKVYNITLTEETPAAELRGHYIPKGGEFVWQDGPAMRAYREGARLVLNEIDRASGDAMIFLHALLDDPEVSAITLPTGETVRPSEGFSAVATTNELPEDLTDGLRDRFSVSIRVDRPHPSALASLPNDLRSVAEKSTTSNAAGAVTFRAWKSFAMLRDAIGHDAAALAVFGDRAQTIVDTMAIEKKG